MNKMFGILIISLSCISYSFSQQTEHLMGSMNESVNSVSTNSMTAKIANAAIQYQQHIPVPRIAQFDYAFAQDIDEYKKLNELGILYIASMNQDSMEFPIQNVYFKHANGIIELQLIFSQPVAVTDELTKTVFGNHRVDFYYLMPYVITQIPGQLLIDWKRNRKGFVLKEFPAGFPLDYITDKKLLFPDTNKKDIQNIDLDVFAKREFQIKIY